MFSAGSPQTTIFVHLLPQKLEVPNNMSYTYLALSVSLVSLTQAIFAV